MKRKKKLISIILASVMLIGMLPMTMFAADPEVFEIDGILYRLWDDPDEENAVEVCVTGTHEYSGNVVIPETVDINGTAHTVTRIRQWAFNKDDELVSVTMPKTIKEIGENAFQECTALERVVMSDNITHIGKQAFDKCTELDINKMPEKLKIIDEEAFRNCDSIKELEFGEGLSSVGQRAFMNCDSLVNVEMNSDDTDIQEAAFSGCTALESITLPSGIKKIKNQTFNGCSALKEAVIPDSVEIIGESAFDGCSALSNVIVSENAETISKRAFYGCSSLEEITIPSSVTTIGDNAFYNCSKLKKVNFDEGLESIGTFAFYETAIESVVVPSTVTSIEYRAFSNCENLISVNYLGDKPSTPQNPENGQMIYNGSTNVISYFNPASSNWSEGQWEGQPCKALIKLSYKNGNETGKELYIMPDVPYELDKNEFVNKGKIFTGWSTSPNGEILYEDCAEVSFDKDTELYAQWEKCTNHIFEDGVCTICGHVQSVLTTDIGEKDFKVGIPVEFTFTTEANDDLGTMVIGTSNFSDKDAIEKLEYYEVQDGSWHTLDGDFGPSTGFPMSNATSRFRVTFAKAGDYTFTASMKSADNGDELCSAEVDFEVLKNKLELTVDDDKLSGKGTVILTIDGLFDGDKAVVVCDDENIVVNDNGDGTYSAELPNESKTYTFTAVPLDTEKYEFDEVTVKVKRKTSSSSSHSLEEKERDDNKDDDRENDKTDEDKIILTINSNEAIVFGERVVNDTAPIIRNDSTMLPIRFVAEALGGTVGWNDAERKVTILKDNTVIELFIDQQYAMINGLPVQLYTAPFIENNRTYLPVRFVAENLGATVLWNEDNMEVTIIPNK